MLAIQNRKQLPKTALHCQYAWR